EVDFEGKYYRVEKARLNTNFSAPDRSSPEIYVSGHSERSEALASSQGTCWLRVADTPEKLEPIVARMRQRGIEISLRLWIVCRSSREAAVQAVESLLPADQLETTIRLKDDSSMYREGAKISSERFWLNRGLWTGLVPHYGPVWTTLLGTPDELAQAFL